MFKSLAEPNRTKSYKLERVLDKNLESFPSSVFPKLWNAIEIDLKETKSAKIKQGVINIYLENYERFKCKKSSGFAYLCLCIHHPLHPVFYFISTLIPLISPCQGEEGQPQQFLDRATFSTSKSSSFQYYLS